MESTFPLTFVAQTATTLVGFSAVLRSFNSRETIDGHSTARVQSVVENGLVLTLLCLLPSLLETWRLSDLTALRVASTLGAVHSARWLALMGQASTADFRMPVTFYAAVGIVLTQFLSFSAAALNSFPASSLALFCTACYASLFHIALGFFVDF